MNLKSLKYKDVPGTIGLIGTKLGEYKVNVGIMQVGRDVAGGEAIMILTLDHPVPDKVIKELIDLDYVFDATKLKL